MRTSAAKAEGFLQWTSRATLSTQILDHWMSLIMFIVCQLKTFYKLQLFCNNCELLHHTKQEKAEANQLTNHPEPYSHIYKATRSPNFKRLASTPGNTGGGEGQQEGVQGRPEGVQGQPEGGQGRPGVDGWHRMTRPPPAVGHVGHDGGHAREAGHARLASPAASLRESAQARFGHQACCDLQRPRVPFMIRQWGLLGEVA